MAVAGLLLHPAGVKAGLPTTNLDGPVIVRVTAVNGKADLLSGLFCDLLGESVSRHRIS